MKRNDYEIDKICKNCEYASFLSDEDIVLCKEKGVVSCGYKCSKFTLDIMKISPKRTKTLEAFEPIDID